MTATALAVAVLDLRDGRVEHHLGAARGDELARSAPTSSPGRTSGS